MQAVVTLGVIKAELDARSIALDEDLALRLPPHMYAAYSSQPSPLSALCLLDLAIGTKPELVVARCVVDHWLLRYIDTCSTTARSLIALAGQSLFQAKGSKEADRSVCGRHAKFGLVIAATAPRHFCYTATVRSASSTQHCATSVAVKSLFGRAVDYIGSSQD